MPNQLTKEERNIDEIDRLLFNLAGNAESSGLSELAIAIRRARAISYQLLPEWRRREVS